ncbi:phage baseplate assembly protein V [Sphingomonas koreensis]|uniref:phage baseplate assembly protein V n=1 Tax=Sphingomonas koreensis TaxID=93064 RepID=UPI000F7F259F|nr:phage baseplate assembly protein V [Sphingomonas koreensis]MDC7808793.1 phage baseplate assembly protein V [Sphingomonas koreensis]RSU98933.1 phage baseplate assembly protein V [Sphingomonas koreensis]
MRDSEDPHGRIGELLRIGKVEQVDLAGGRIVVAVGEIRTSQIRWLERRAGKTRTWSPPSEGEQLLLLCPEGDIEGAIALGGLTQNAFPLPGNSARELIQFDDGSIVAFDPGSSTLDVTLADGATLNIVTGSATITAPDGVVIEGDVSITGDLAIDGKVTVTGDVEADGDVKAGAISLKTHKHGGVTAGAAQTQVPA